MHHYHDWLICEWPSRLHPIANNSPCLMVLSSSQHRVLDGAGLWKLFRSTQNHPMAEKAAGGWWCANHHCSSHSRVQHFGQASCVSLPLLPWSVPYPGDGAWAMPLQLSALSGWAIHVGEKKFSELVFTTAWEQRIREAHRDLLEKSRTYAAVILCHFHHPFHCTFMQVLFLVLPSAGS